MLTKLNAIIKKMIFSSVIDNNRRVLTKKPKKTSDNLYLIRESKRFLANRADAESGYSLIKL